MPIYPGASPERISSHDAGIEHYFTVWLNTRDDRTEIIEWYENKLHSAGYTTFSRLIDDYGLQSEGPGHTRSIKIDLGTHGDGVEIQIQAVERNVSGGAAPSLPNWVPTYPGTAPGHMEARKSHDEYHLAFSFTSADDPTKIYSWYKTKLEALGFRVSFDVTPHSGGLESNNSDNTRTFNMRNYPGASKNTFTVELMDRPAQ